MLGKRTVMRVRLLTNLTRGRTEVTNDASNMNDGLSVLRKCLMFYQSTQSRVLKYYWKLPPKTRVIAENISGYVKEDLSLSQIRRFLTNLSCQKQRDLECAYAGLLAKQTE